MVFFIRLPILGVSIYCSLLVIRLSYSFFCEEDALCVLQNKKLHIRLLKIASLITFGMVLVAFGVSLLIVMAHYIINQSFF